MKMQDKEPENGAKNRKFHSQLLIFFLLCNGFKDPSNENALTMDPDGRDGIDPSLLLQQSRQERTG